MMEMLKVGWGGLSPHPHYPWPQGVGSHPCFATGQAKVGVSPPVSPWWGASHLGAGGTTLSGTAGLSSFTL